MVISLDYVLHPSVVWGLAVPVLGPVVPGAGLDIVVAIHKDHSMAAHGGAAECLWAPLRYPERKQM